MHMSKIFEAILIDKMQQSFKQLFPENMSGLLSKCIDVVGK